MKICYKCKEAKPFDAFSISRRNKDGLLGMCRACKSLYNKAFINKTEKCKIRNRNYYLKNKEKIKQKRVEYVKAYRATHKEDMSSYSKHYYQANKQRITARYRNKRHTDLRIRLAHNLRSRLSNILKDTNKACSAVRNLGCTLEELRQHLESGFHVGMNWQNYGDWHIDHIKPLSKFDLEDKTEFLRAIHYTNLQPLWARDNLSKGDKINTIQ